MLATIMLELQILINLKQEKYTSWSEVKSK